MTQRVQTLIVGGGQAGLAISYYLTQQGHEHIVLEKASQPGSAWRNDRWDSFTLNTPNWAFRMPGGEYAGADPDGFMSRAEVVRAFETYLDRYRLPVQFGEQATSVEAFNGGYLVKTNSESYKTDNVVIATGLYQQAKIPDFSARIPADILQIPSGKYRNPDALPPGAVLVAGSAQSGCQIAEELYQSGRTVYLCTGRCGRAPRRYRGRDAMYWLDRVGYFNRTPAQLPSPQARFAGNPQVSGNNGGHDLNLHQFTRDGVRLLGRLADARDGKIYLAPDLHENLAWADQIEANIIKMIDDYIVENSLESPAENRPVLRDGFESPFLSELDLQAAGIGAVIWAMGHRFDFSLVRLPVVDEAGFPVTEGGATRFPGLYFLGMPWMPSLRTGVLLGVGEAAAMIASMIVPGS